MMLFNVLSHFNPFVTMKEQELLGGGLGQLFRTPPSMASRPPCVTRLPCAMETHSTFP